MIKEIHFPHSLGLLYSAFTYYTGFKVNSGEYKVMGLAPYGKPTFIDQMRKIVLLKNESDSLLICLNNLILISVITLFCTYDIIVLLI